MRKLAQLRSTIDGWVDFQSRVLSTIDLVDMAIDSEDFSLESEIAQEAEILFEDFQAREFQLVFSGEYDDHSAILAIHAGAGGTDSQDWTEMLLRMYTRWGDQNGYKTQILDLSEGEEAGIKSATIEISGPNAYGYAKTESGVHRLVRLSPFDSSHARHTSFALVEVLPEVDNDVEVQINADDIEMDVFRASGAGGQSVQKNSTAVRIRHLPSGLVVSCQNERSQHKNKETCMNMLKARLYEFELQKKEKESSKIENNKSDIGWGHQIRSYVLHPYRMVKDNRTNYENSNPDKVLDGDIDSFLESSLYKINA